MLKEALDALVLLARQSVEPGLVDGKDPRAVCFTDPSGNVTKLPIPIPPRRHKVESLEDLIALAKRFDTEDDSEGKTPFPVVWYNAERVVLVIDDIGHRIETATLELAKSDLFETVKKMSGTWYDHKAFIRLLKVGLIGALAPETLLNVVRRIKFENGTIVAGEIKKNRESMGREIVAAVSAEGEIPDVVTLTVPVYKTYGLRDTYSVRCTVECDPMEGRFRLMAFPDEIEFVFHLVLTEIAEELADGLPEGVPHYLGAP